MFDFTLGDLWVQYFAPMPLWVFLILCVVGSFAYEMGRAAAKSMFKED